MRHNSPAVWSFVWAGIMIGAGALLLVRRQQHQEFFERLFGRRSHGNLHVAYRYILGPLFLIVAGIILLLGQILELVIGR